jgi:DNA-binding MarR family transcriptional regulator
MDAAQTVDARKASHATALLASVGRLAAEQLTAALRSNGLRALHLAALAELRRGARSQQALGEATGADPVRLVGVLNDLETEGLVSRRRDPMDRRRHIVEMSDSGRARLTAAEAAVGAVEERMLAKLDPDERRQLESLLAAIAETSGEHPCEAAFKADDDACTEE